MKTDEAPSSSSSTPGNASSLWADVPRRLATICLGIPLLWLVWWRDWSRQLFFQGTHLVMCWEWMVIAKLPMRHALLWIATSAVLVQIADDALFLLGLSLTAAGLSMTRHGVHLHVMAMTTGLLLITLPMRCWIWSIGGDFGQTIWLLLTVWNADTGALVGGRVTRLVRGTQNLWPRPTWLVAISPAKSLEGLLGGLVSGTLTYVYLTSLWTLLLEWHLVPLEANPMHQTSLLHRLSIGLILSFAAILGDLWESSLKRTFDVKDSGKLLPGHGGVLDRFDSSLLAVLVYRYYQEEYMAR